MTDFVYNADYSKVLLAHNITISKTSIFLYSEVHALLKWVSDCTNCTSQQKKELTLAIKEHFSNAKAFVNPPDRFNRFTYQVQRLLKYEMSAQKKDQNKIGLLRNFSAGKSSYDRKTKSNFSIRTLSTYGFSKTTTIKTFKLHNSSQINDSTKTSPDILFSAKKQKNFIESANKLELLLDSFVKINKANSPTSCVKYEVVLVPKNASYYSEKKEVFEAEVEVAKIISHLKDFNKSIIGVIKLKMPDLLKEDLENYTTKPWVGSFDSADNFKAKEAFYILATSGKLAGFVGMKKTNHSIGELWRPTIVKDINSAYIFHTMPDFLNQSFTNIHKVSVGVDFSNVSKVGRADSFDLALKVQSFIEKNKLESTLSSLPLPGNDKSDTLAGGDKKKVRVSKI